jgi:hypothetical protein
MAGYQFDELTKDLAGAKSRRGFLKGLLGAAGLAAAATGALMPLSASAAPNNCPPGRSFPCGTGCCPNGMKCVGKPGAKNCV